MTSRPMSQCGACIHARGPFSPEAAVFGEGGPFCAAFPQPEGIPDDVYGNRRDHRVPIEGDHGIQWESDDGIPFPTYAFDPANLRT